MKAFKSQGPALFALSVFKEVLKIAPSLILPDPYQPFSPHTTEHRGCIT